MSLDTIKIRKGNPTNATNRLKFFLLQLKDRMMETSCCPGEGPWALATHNSYLGVSGDIIKNAQTNLSFKSMWSMKGKYSRPLIKEVTANTFFSSSVSAGPPFGLMLDASVTPWAEASRRLSPSMPSGGTMREADWFEVVVETEIFGLFCSALLIPFSFSARSRAYSATLSINCHSAVLFYRVIGVNFCELLPAQYSQHNITLIHAFLWHIYVIIRKWCKRSSCDISSLNILL